MAVLWEPRYKCLPLSGGLGLPGSWKVTRKTTRQAEELWVQIYTQEKEAPSVLLFRGVIDPLFGESGLSEAIQMWNVQNPCPAVPLPGIRAVDLLEHSHTAM